MAPSGDFFFFLSFFCVLFCSFERRRVCFWGSPHLPLVSEDFVVLGSPRSGFPVFSGNLGGLPLRAVALFWLSFVFFWSLVLEDFVGSWRSLWFGSFEGLGALLVIDGINEMHA